MQQSGKPGSAAVGGSSDFDHSPMVQALEEAPFAVVVTDGLGAIRYLNSQAESMFGYPRAELWGQAVEILVPQQYRAVHPLQRQKFGEQAHRRPMGIGMDLMGRAKNGQEFPVEIGISSTRINAQLHYVCYITDISQRKEIEKKLAASEARFRNLVNNAPDGVFVINQVGRIVQANQAGLQIFGYSEAELIGMTVETLMPEAIQHSLFFKDAEKPAQLNAHKFTAGQDLEALRKDGTAFRAEVNLSFLSNDEGELVIAIVRDITDRVRMERRHNLLAQVVQQMKDAVILTDSDLESKIRYVNKAFTELYGYAEEEVLGRSSWILFGGDGENRADILEQRNRDIAAQNQSHSEYMDRKKDGSRFWVSNTSSEIRLSAGEKPFDLGIVRDVSDQVRYRNLLAKQNTFLTALHETSLGILGQFDLPSLLEALIEKVVLNLECAHGIVYLADDRQNEMNGTAGTGLFRTLVGSRVRKAEGFIGRVWQTGQTLVCDSPLTEEHCLGFPVSEEVGCVIGTPLRLGSQVIGVICVAGGSDRLDAVTQAEMGLNGAGMLAYFGQLASIAVVNAQLFTEAQQALQATQKHVARMDRELEMARSVQFALLPHQPPDLPGWSFSAMWKPAMEVAGDYYDIFVREDGWVDLLIADVTDKGVPAALFMAYSKSLLNMCLQNTPSLLEGVTLANRLLVEKDVGPFVTAFLARINTVTGEMIYVNAGHPPAMIYCSDSNRMIELPRTGVPLGITSELEYQQGSLFLEKDDFLFLYTDGITEAADGNLDLFGYERLKAAIRRHNSAGVETIARRIIDEVGAFTAQSDPQDDVAILVVKRK